MTQVILPFVAGLLGTAVMTVFLLLPRWMNMAHVDVVRAVGSLITGRIEGAYMPGLAVHAGSGILFAYVYQAVLHFSNVPFTFMSGLFLGGVHGAIVMLLVCITVMEHHPMAKYHRRGPMTAVMQLVAHLVYGGTVGLVMQALAPRAA